MSDDVDGEGRKEACGKRAASNFESPTGRGILLPGFAGDCRARCGTRMQMRISHAETRRRGAFKDQTAARFGRKMTSFVPLPDLLYMRVR